MIARIARGAHRFHIGRFESARGGQSLDALERGRMRREPLRDRVAREWRVIMACDLSEIEPKLVKQPKIYKEQKLYRLPTDLIEGLREMAYEKSKKEGRRVTETEIVEQAIREHIDSYL